MSDDVGQQTGLGQHQSGRQDTESDGAHQITAGGGSLPHQPRIERLHAAPVMATSGT